MIKKILNGLFPGKGRGSNFDALIQKITQIEATYDTKSDEELREISNFLSQRALSGESLNGSLRNEAYALVKTAAKRALGLTPHNVQVLAALHISEGRIAEMKTGEGKTLAAAFPAYLFSLVGKGVHVVTVNDYLAHRDAEDIGRIYQLLGRSVGVVVSNMNDFAKREAYNCDITYATNSEIGFDYLKDNLRFATSQMVQRGRHFAIIDEADSILIDEARTPLIISEQVGGSAERYIQIREIVASLIENTHYKVDSKDHTSVLTELGSVVVESKLMEAGLISESSPLHSGQNIDLNLQIDSTLKAHTLLFKNKDYVVQDGQVVIVDSFTGRLQPGRRFNDGIHQAIEAKEGVYIESENRTLSSITYQSLFRAYTHLSGMSGTADSERDEFAAVYGLEIAVIPTHRPVIRKDIEDLIYLTEMAKIKSVVEAVQKAHAKKQPILIGTPSIEKSEMIASHLVAAGLKRMNNLNLESLKDTFQVLNAHNHAMEAKIIAFAGVPGSITIATNMAGRGTDIQLGGDLQFILDLVSNEFEPNTSEWLEKVEEETKRHAELQLEARAAGGLLVIGTERNESRRVDDQLRGRSGRQGDPGMSVFFVSLEDEIVATYGSGISKITKKIGFSGDGAISHPLLSRAVMQAQMSLEGRNREIRSNMMAYEDITNEQHLSFHEMRMDIMGTNDVSDIVNEMREETITSLVDRHIPTNSFPQQWDIDGLSEAIKIYFRMVLPLSEWMAEDGVDAEVMFERINAAAIEKLTMIETEMPSGIMRVAEKTALLMSVDKIWREHTYALDELKAAVGLRTIGQRDPIIEFRTDAFEMFKAAMAELSLETTMTIMRITPNRHNITATSGELDQENVA